MRVALVLPDNIGFSPVTGGAVNIMAGLYSNLASIDTDIIACPDESEYEGFRIRHVPWWGLVSKTRDLPLGRIGFRLRRSAHPTLVSLMVRKRYDAIHVLNRPAYPNYLRRIDKRTPVIVFIKNDHMLRLSQVELERSVRCTNAFICVSHYLAQGIRNRHPEADSKLHVLPNGIEMARFASAMKRNHPERVVLFVGRLTQNKGVHLLIKAMKRVLKRVPDAHLMIVGGSWFGRDHDTPYIARLRTSARDLGDRITFTGSVSHSELPDFYARADVFVSPSIWQEPFGQMNLEAMATGAPVVTSNRGGIPEVVGDAALLVEPEDTDALADTILRVLESKSLASELARRGQERVRERFDWGVLAGRYQELFERIALG